MTASLVLYAMVINQQKSIQIVQYKEEWSLQYQTQTCILPSLSFLAHIHNTNIYQD